MSQPRTYPNTPTNKAVMARFGPPEAEWGEESDSLSLQQKFQLARLTYRVALWVARAVSLVAVVLIVVSCLKTWTAVKGSLVDGQIVNVVRQ